MTPKEKATDLLNRVSECGEDNEMYIETAKNCALFVVDEIINQYNLGIFDYKILNEKEFNYWNEVKQEIEKL